MEHWGKAHTGLLALLALALSLRVCNGRGRAPGRLRVPKSGPDFSHKQRRTGPTRIREGRKREKEEKDTDTSEKKSESE